MHVVVGNISNVLLSRGGRCSSVRQNWMRTRVRDNKVRHTEFRSYHLSNGDSLDIICLYYVQEDKEKSKNDYAVSHACVLFR